MLFTTIQRKKADYHEYTQTHSKRKFSKNPEWTKVDDMTLDTFCGKHTYIPEENFEIDDELLWILGRYIADGHLGSGKRKTGYYYQTVISVGTNKLDDFKKQVTKRHFSCYLHSQNVYRCVFSSKELYNLIVQNDFGRTAHEKKIPEKFMRLPIEKSKILLDGYLSGDGCFIPENGAYNCSTVSPVLALQIQRLVAHIYKTNAGLCVNKKILKDMEIDVENLKAEQRKMADNSRKPVSQQEKYENKAMQADKMVRAARDELYQNNQEVKRYESEKESALDIREKRHEDRKKVKQDYLDR